MYLIIFTYKNQELCITRRFCISFLIDSLINGTPSQFICRKFSEIP